ncbi:MAG: TonB C-terminal domain-containing protein, partial [Phyllobacteriaceae bacterium]|nr:TonB C-terminal domain-containing protein [Phyllobacteriaceae bacterium]
VVSHAITRSSGSPDLDAAVASIMAATHVPPPPNGRFRGSITLHFALTP